VLDRTWHQLLATAGRAVRLGVDRHDLVRAVEQGLEVFGGEFWGAGKDDAHGVLASKEKGLPEQAFWKVGIRLAGGAAFPASS
jgi:hypothetical protein